MVELLDTTGPIVQSIYKVGDQIVSFIPILIAVVILIVLGRMLGKILGKFGSKILDKIGLDDLIDKTSIGGIIKKGGVSTVAVFETIIRWFIYIIFTLVIIDVLKISIVADFISKIILFVPLILTALIILIIGILVIDALAEMVRKVVFALGLDEKIEKSSIGSIIKAGKMTVSGLLSGIVRLFGYLVVMMIVSEILQMRFLTQFLMGVVNYLPNLITGILILLIGFLTIDFMTDYLKNMMKGMISEVETIMPVLRSFLFLIVVLLALDTMLIKTNIFYTFLGPIAWGFAIIIAFRWGVKDAIIAYVKEKKDRQ